MPPQFDYFVKGEPLNTAAARAVASRTSARARRQLISKLASRLGTSPVHKKQVAVAAAAAAAAVAATGVRVGKSSSSAALGGQFIPPRSGKLLVVSPSTAAKRTKGMFRSATSRGAVRSRRSARNTGGEHTAVRQGVFLPSAKPDILPSHMRRSKTDLDIVLGGLPKERQEAEREKMVLETAKQHFDALYDEMQRQREELETRQRQTELQLKAEARQAQTALDPSGSCMALADRIMRGVFDELGGPLLDLDAVEGDTGPLSELGSFNLGSSLPAYASGARTSRPIRFAAVAPPTPPATAGPMVADRFRTATVLGLRASREGPKGGGFGMGESRRGARASASRASTFRGGMVARPPNRSGGRKKARQAGRPQQLFSSKSMRAAIRNVASSDGTSSMERAELMTSSLKALRVV